MHAPLFLPRRQCNFWMPITAFTTNSTYSRMSSDRVALPGRVTSGGMEMAW